VIVLRAKNVEFKVTYIDLRDKPDWFLDISPHGKVPVLVVDQQPLFESNAIAEFLDETVTPHLHPIDPIKRARNRAWTDFVVDFSRALGGVSYAKDQESMQAGFELARKRLGRLEEAIRLERGNDGPYFNGNQLCIVDAAYAPFLQRFTIVEQVIRSGLLNDYPLIQAWTDALLANGSVRGSVVADFEAMFAENLKRRQCYAGSLMEPAPAAG
jgi:glutathione S-transferase